MKDVNSLVLTGRLTSEVEQHGALTTFGFAVHRMRADNGEWIEVTFFVTVKVFGKAGDRCAEYLDTGRMAAITGGLDVEEYQLAIGGNDVFYDKEKKRPVMMKEPVVLTDNVVFLKG